MRSPSSAIVPWQVTITLGFASHNICSYKNKQLQPQYIAKTQHQVSPGTHVAVPALMGLEEPPTAHGVPLSSMAKSSPLSALVRFQESLHRGNSSSAGFFIKDLQKPPQAWVHHFKEGIFVAFTAHPQDCKCFHIVINLQKNQGLVAHHRTQPSQFTVPLNLQTQPKSTSQDNLYSTPPHKSAHICIRITQMGPCRLRPSLGSSHVQNGISHAVPLFLSVRTHKPPPQVPGPPCVPESQKPSCQDFPLCLSKLLTQVNQLHLTICSIRRELSHIGDPLRMPP